MNPEQRNVRYVAESQALGIEPRNDGVAPIHIDVVRDRMNSILKPRTVDSSASAGLGYPVDAQTEDAPYSAPGFNSSDMGSGELLPGVGIP